MDRSTTLGGNSPLSSSTNSNPAASVQSAAQAAHQAVEGIADKANAQVDRLSGTAHRTVDRAADAAGSAVEQVKQVQTRVTEAACASIRARPISTVAGALVIGYLLGRLARF